MNKKKEIQERRNGIQDKKMRKRKKINRQGRWSEIVEEEKYQIWNSESLLEKEETTKCAVQSKVALIGKKWNRWQKLIIKQTLVQIFYCTKYCFIQGLDRIKLLDQIIQMFLFCFLHFSVPYFCKADCLIIYCFNFRLSNVFSDLKNILSLWN